MQTTPHHPRALIEGINIAIIARRAARRAGVGQGDGARPVPGLAARPVVLSEIAAETGRFDEPATPPGYRTARRREPMLLARLPEKDTRRIAARIFADTCEKIGASSCAAIEGSISSAGIPDGGATTKIKHAQRLAASLKAIRHLVRTEGEKGGIAWRPRVVLPLGRPSPKRHEIKALDLLVAVAIEGRDIAEILRRAGWSKQAHTTRLLGAAALLMLDDLAECYGLGRMVPRESS